MIVIPKKVEKELPTATTFKFQKTNWWRLPEGATRASVSPGCSQYNPHQSHLPPKPLSHLFWEMASSISMSAYMLRHSCTRICVHAHTPLFTVTQMPLPAFGWPPNCRSSFPSAEPQVIPVIPSLLIPWDGSLPEPSLALSESLMAHLQSGGTPLQTWPLCEKKLEL